MSEASSKKQNNHDHSEQSDGEELFNKPVKEKNQSGQVFWELGNKKRATISEFKNKTYVNIREFYEKDGKLLPSTKGISLPIEQWQNLMSIVNDIDSEITKADKSKGIKKIKK